MMRRRRSKSEQAIDILSNAIEPILMTPLLTKANINWGATKSLFMFLEECGFLKRVEPVDPEHRENIRVKFGYQTTQKGLKALELSETPPLRELLDCYEWIKKQKEAEN